MEVDQNSEAAAIESLRGIIPEDGYNIGQVEEDVAPTQETETKPAEDAPEVKAEAPKDDKADAPAQEAQPTEVEIEYEGNRYKLPAELKDAFMRERDYRFKTMELADQKRALEANKTNPPELQQYQAQITHYQNLLGQQVLQDSQINWQELLRTDPIGYLEKKEQAEARAREWKQLSEQKQRETQQKLGQTLDQEAQQLIAKQPEWKDVARFNADKEKIFSSLEKVGYTRQEFDSVLDHRALIIADKARRYDELMAAKEVTVKKIEKLPPKVERPGVPDASESQASQAAMNTLRKSGRVDDAAAAIRSLMN